MIRTGRDDGRAAISHGGPTMLKMAGGGLAVKSSGELKVTTRRDSTRQEAFATLRCSRRSR